MPVLAAGRTAWPRCGSGLAAPVSAVRTPGWLAFALPLWLLLTATQNQAQQPPARAKIGLVLSGGGARGVAHVGVLKVLQELHVPVDIVVGTSMGSIVGGAYASGMSPQDMERRIRDAQWDRVLADRPPRAERSIRSKEVERRNIYGLELGLREGAFRLPKGALFGQQLEVFLATLTTTGHDLDSFDDLHIPYRAVATDIETGRMVVLDRGDLTRAMRASMSVPGVFAPVEIDGKLLVDGGLVRNLPVDVARKLGADEIIAVNLGTPLLKREEIASVVSVSAQVLNILTEQNVQASLAELRPHDILISPELGDHAASDFTGSAETIAIGEAAARRHAQVLARLSLSEQEYAQHLQSRGARSPSLRQVDALRIDANNLKWVNPQAVAATIGTQPGEAPDTKQIQAQLQALYASDDFQQIRYRFEDAAGRRVLVIEPIEKEWGPNYLQLGLNLSTDLQGDSSFDLLLDHRMTWLNSRGLEWRNDISVGRTISWRSELNQPLNLVRTVFVAPFVELRQTRDNIFLDNDPIVSYKTRRAVGGLDLGYRFARAATLRLGYSAGRVKSSPALALPFFSSLEQDVGELSARLVYDRLDDWAFPSSGVYANSELLWSRRALGADSNYQSAQGEISAAFSRGAHRLLLGLRGGSNMNSELPLFNQFSLGGFLNLSGLQNRQLLGPRFALARAVYYRRFGGASLVSMPVYVGGSLEAGNVHERFNGAQSSGALLAGSLFAAIDTTLGPLYVAVGLAEGGNYAFYVFLGRP